MLLGIALRSLIRLDLPKSHLEALHLAQATILEVGNKARLIEYNRRVAEHDRLVRAGL